MDASPQYRCKGGIHLDTSLAQGAAGLAHLRFPQEGQLDIGPSGEALFAIPLGFAMAEKDKTTGHGERASGPRACRRGCPEGRPGQGSGQQLSRQTEWQPSGRRTR